MIVIGAKGHAKEVLTILRENQLLDGISFFDNVTEPKQDKLYETFLILHTIKQVKQHLKKSPQFISAIGNPLARAKVVAQFQELGGKYISMIAQNSIIGKYDVKIEDGCNIMQNVSIANSTAIGVGSLINYGASIHHDTTIGEFCDIGPNSSILGRATIGDFVSIGAGAIILPDVTINDYAIIGAGAVVTKDVSKKDTVVGNPAKSILK